MVGSIMCLMKWSVIECEFPKRESRATDGFPVALGASGGVDHGREQP
jgi:hypothetical protein